MIKQQVGRIALGEIKKCSPSENGAPSIRRQRANRYDFQLANLQASMNDSFLVSQPGGQISFSP